MLTLTGFHIPPCEVYAKKQKFPPGKNVQAALHCSSASVFTSSWSHMVVHWQDSAEAKQSCACPVQRDPACSLCAQGLGLPRRQQFRARSYFSSPLTLSFEKGSFSAALAVLIPQPRLAFNSQQSSYSNLSSARITPVPTHGFNTS